MSVPASARSTAIVVPSLTDHSLSPPRTTAGPAPNPKPRSSSQSWSSGLKLSAVRSFARVGVRSPRAASVSGPGLAWVTGACTSVGRKRIGIGTAAGCPHGSQLSVAGAVRSGGGTSPSGSLSMVRPWSARTTLPHASPTISPGCASAEMQSGKGSASAASQAISVIATDTFAGGSAKSPPDGSADETTLVRRTAARLAGSASSDRPVSGPATSARINTSPAVRAGCVPTSVADVAPRGRQQPVPPHVQKLKRSCEP